MMQCAAAPSALLWNVPWSRFGKFSWVLGLAFALSGGVATGQYLDPSDTAIAIDVDAVFGLNGEYPGAEGPVNVIDGNVGSKYLNFGREGSGFIVTPSVLTPVESFQITTANDWPGRDPGSWELYGFSGILTTVDSGPSPAINADGLAEAWTLIDSGALSLPGDPTMSGDQRGVVGPLVVVNPGMVDAGYEHYKMIFPTVKDNTAPAVDSLQFAEIQFFSDEPGTGGSAFLAPGNPIVAVDEIRAWNGSSYPGGERPALVLDQDSDTKYLNFGEEGSGLIITNSGGPVQVGVMQLTTANDAEPRDPASYELWGTDDPIQSVDNSEGLGGELWTLISSGPLSLPSGREDNSTFVPINAGAAYTSYKLIFPTVKDAAGANSMQIADVQLYLVPEPSSLLLLLGGFGTLIARAYQNRIKSRCGGLREFLAEAEECSSSAH